MSLNEHPLLALCRAHSSWGAVVARGVPDPWRGPACAQLVPSTGMGWEAALLAARSARFPGMLLDALVAVR